MSLTHILILDEDEEMRSLIAGQINTQEYCVDQAGSFLECLEKLKTASYSLLLMDSKIPDISTSDFLSLVRASHATANLGILILLPRSSDSDQERWKVLGANDFLTKPFDRGSLLNKIKMLVRTTGNTVGRADDKPGQISSGELTLDTQSFDVFCRGERLHLTPNEFKLLQALLSHLGDVLSRERLIELVQGYGIAVIDRAVDTHIFSLRKKLGSFGDTIETVRGSGYRMARELI